MASKGIILSSGPVHDILREILGVFGEIVIAASPAEEDIIPLVHNALAYIVRGDGIATSKIINNANQLKAIGRTGVGYESVDLKAATERRIPVLITPGANARSVAEASLTFMLTLAKKIIPLHMELKQGNWNARYTYKPRDFENSVVGIIGFGSIGRELAKLLSGLGVQVVFYDPFINTGDTDTHGASPVEFEELLSISDFICLHTALTEDTKGLINPETINFVKPGSFIVNLARGGVVSNLDLLYSALNDGVLSGVALDVFNPEPPDVRHPIFSHPNCICTPHAVGMTPGAVKRSFEILSRDIEAVLTGKKPTYIVNPEIYGSTTDNQKGEHDDA